MNLGSVNDDGKDLKVGDIVWIKGRIETDPTPAGDVKVRYFARPGYDEYARPGVNAIFLRRSKLNWFRRLFKR
jgi:hypothetical protein